MNHVSLDVPDLFDRLRLLNDRLEADEIIDTLEFRYATVRDIADDAVRIVDHLRREMEDDRREIERLRRELGLVRARLEEHRL